MFIIFTNCSHTCLLKVTFTLDNFFASHRTAVKAVAERVGQSAFFFAAQGFLEKDRTLFALLTAIEVA